MQLPKQLPLTVEYNQKKHIHFLVLGEELNINMLRRLFVFVSGPRMFLCFIPSLVKCHLVAKTNLYLA